LAVSNRRTGRRARCGKQDDPDLEQGGDANILVCLAPAIPVTGRPTRAFVHC
jgi:hypothetical protein